jgi:hypothetical protein
MVRGHDPMGGLVLLGLLFAVWLVLGWARSGSQHEKAGRVLESGRIAAIGEGSDPRRGVPRAPLDRPVRVTPERAESSEYLPPGTSASAVAAEAVDRYIALLRDIGSGQFSLLPLHVEDEHKERLPLCPAPAELGARRLTVRVVTPALITEIDESPWGFRWYYAVFFVLSCDGNALRWSCFDATRQFVAGAPDWFPGKRSDQHHDALALKDQAVSCWQIALSDARKTWAGHVMAEQRSTSTNTKGGRNLSSVDHAQAAADE